MDFRLSFFVLHIHFNSNTWSCGESSSQKLNGKKELNNQFKANKKFNKPNFASIQEHVELKMGLKYFVSFLEFQESSLILIIMIIVIHHQVLFRKLNIEKRIYALHWRSTCRRRLLYYTGFHQIIFQNISLFNDVF